MYNDIINALHSLILWVCVFKTYPKEIKYADTGIFLVTPNVSTKEHYIVVMSPP